MMEHVDIVMAEHPQAHIVYNPRIVGADLPLDHEGHFIVYRTKELGADVLGKGKTRGEAWKNAA